MKQMKQMKMKMRRRRREMMNRCRREEKEEAVDNTRALCRESSRLPSQQRKGLVSDAEDNRMTKRKKTEHQQKEKEKENEENV